MFWTWVPLERMREFGRERDDQIVRNEETREAEALGERKWKLKSREKNERLRKMKKNRKKKKRSVTIREK